MMTETVVPIEVRDVREAGRPAAPRTIAALLVLHGLAHALPGMRVAEALAWRFPATALGLTIAGVIGAVLWSGATVGFVAGGIGLVGLPPFDRRTRLLLGGAATSSIALLALWGSPLALFAAAVDLAVLAGLRHSCAWLAPRRRSRRRWASRVAQALVLLLAFLIVVRPWHMRWGSTAAELRQRLPGDAGTGTPIYQIQHALTVHAPSEQIWPWLVQLGGERAGFYSYSYLESLFGLHIRNAGRIHPEWQQLAAGDSVFATPVGWLGLDHRLGWRVGMAEPNRVLVLEAWGAVVLEPTAPRTTRLIVRTRGYGPDRILHVLLAPAEFLLFEPVHFVMERRMLIGIRERAEMHSGL